ncbi:protein EVI2B isoform X2 [Sceloporus undulatus]|nr:protein EVI2B isoform X2 [Sceloporus undulatus]
MDVNPAVFIFFYGQMWWNHVSAETQGPANFSSPTMLPTVATTVGDTEITSQTYLTQTRKLGDSIKNNRPLSTAKPQHPITEEPKSHNEHIIAAVVIGVILIVMIVVIVSIFLWRRWKTADLPLPHWAGRSPFADGDLPEIATDKEVANGLKRVSVLSLLPWKFNKETQLLEPAEGSLSESKQNLDALSRCDTEETESSPTVTGNSVSSTSEQTAISGEPGSLVEVPLQAHSPEPLDLPPPPSWIGGTTGDLCPGPSESFSPEPNAEIQCPVPDVSYQNPSETLLLPPPPDELLSN